MVWISRILPLETFTDICQKVYFAVDEDFDEIDFILANGYLTYVFSEHDAITGCQEYEQHSLLCRTNIDFAISQLPLLLPPTMKVVAALTLAVRMHWQKKEHESYVDY